MSLLGKIFDKAINMLRGAIGSFGKIKFEVYSEKIAAIKIDTTKPGLSGLEVKPPTRVFTFDNWQRRSRARYARHDVFNRPSILEKTGNEPDTVTLDVKLVRALGTNPEDESEIIRAYIRNGHPDYLMIGNDIVGTFVMTEMQEQRQFVDAFGRTLVSEIALTFEEVPEDDVLDNQEDDDLEFDAGI